MKDLKTSEQFTNTEFVSLQSDSSVKPPKAASRLADTEFAPVQQSTAVQAEPSDEQAASRGMSLWLVAGLALVFLLGALQWAEFVQQSLTQSWLQGGAALGLTGIGSIAVLRMAFHSWRGRRQRLERERWRQQADTIAQSLQYGQASALCQRILLALPQANADVFRAQHHIQLSDAETLQLFDLLVLQPIDQQAAARISAAAKQVGMAVAMSPFALADMLLVSWRAWRLMGELSALYGVNIGSLQRFALMKQFANLLFWTGATELAIDIGGDFLGVELSSKLSARAGQGVLAAVMLARLGRFVQQQLRPLPLLTAQKNLQPLLQSLIERLLQRPPAQ